MSSIIGFEVPPVLRQKGVTAIEKQGDTIAISYDDKVIRSTFYKSDFDKSMKALQKRCAIHILDNLIIQEIILLVSKVWNELISNNGSENKDDNHSRNANAIYDEIKKDKAANGDISQEEWRINLLEKYNNLRKVIDAPQAFGSFYDINGEKYCAVSVLSKYLGYDIATLSKKIQNDKNKDSAELIPYTILEMIENFTVYGNPKKSLECFCSKPDYYYRYSLNSLLIHLLIHLNDH